MTKGFIATVLAAALALTSFTAIPARADSEDVAKVLLGLAVIAGIAAAVNDRDDDPVVTRRHPRRDTDRRHPRRNDRLALPERCFRVFDTREGNFPAFGRRCLQRHAGRHIDLPRRCESEVRTRRGWRTVYGARCMRRQGFYIAGRGNH